MFVPPTHAAPRGTRGRTRASSRPPPACPPISPRQPRRAPPPSRPRAASRTGRPACPPGRRQPLVRRERRRGCTLRRRPRRPPRSRMRRSSSAPRRQRLAISSATVGSASITRVTRNRSASPASVGKWIAWVAVPAPRNPTRSTDGLTAAPQTHAPGLRLRPHRRTPPAAHRRMPCGRRVGSRPLRTCAPSNVKPSGAAIDHSLPRIVPVADGPLHGASVFGPCTRTVTERGWRGTRRPTRSSDQQLGGSPRRPARAR